MADIFATLGPACMEAETLSAMVQAGMTGLRLNLNHRQLKQSLPQIEAARSAACCLHKPLKLLVDLQGQSLRIGLLPAPVQLQAGETVIFGQNGIPVPKEIYDMAGPGSCFWLSDGRIRVRVDKKEAALLVCSVLQGGLLESRKSIAPENTSVQLPALTAADRECIATMRDTGVDAVMVPFVTERRQLTKIREALDTARCEGTKLWAKVENRAGVENIKEWIDLADYVVIARGDLGNAYPLEHIPVLQAEIGSLCRQKGKPFTVATGLMHSMLQSRTPTRADVSDVFHAVTDGAEGVMLTDETAVGAYPAEAVSFTARAVREAELFCVNRAKTLSFEGKMY